MVSVKKDTAKRMHTYCQRGEKHDNMINRLIDALEEEKTSVCVSESTVDRLLDFCECKDVDDALNVLMDRCRRIR